MPLFTAELARLPTSLPTPASSLPTPLRLTQASSATCPTSPDSCRSSPPSPFDACGRVATASTVDGAAPTQCAPPVELQHYVLGGMDALEELECIGAGAQGSVRPNPHLSVADIARFGWPVARGRVDGTR